MALAPHWHGGLGVAYRACASRCRRRIAGVSRRRHACVETRGGYRGIAA